MGSMERSTVGTPLRRCNAPGKGDIVTPQERFRTAVLPVWINVALIFCLVVWLHGGNFIPSGDPARDAAMHPRADMMVFYGAALLARTNPSQLYDVDRQGEAQKAATGLEISGRY